MATFGVNNMINDNDGLEDGLRLGNSGARNSGARNREDRIREDRIREDRIRGMVMLCWRFVLSHFMRYLMVRRR
jgi:hypothetical protein